MDTQTTRPSVAPITRLIGENGSRIDRVGTVAVLSFMLWWFMGESREQNLALSQSIDSLKETVVQMKHVLEDIREPH